MNPPVSELDQLISIARTNVARFDEARLRYAYSFADIALASHLRHTGEATITHPLAVAVTLASWSLDQASIEAALLHELPDMAEIPLQRIREAFGDEVANLVDGVTEVGKVRLRGSQTEVFLENMRRMFISMARDIRVVLIRLADRLHNMQTLDAIPLMKQRRIAMETIDVYAPLAERLGMGQLKGDLEDMAFPFIYPEEHQWLLELAEPHFAHSERLVNECIDNIRQQLLENKLEAIVDGRPKRKYSLYKKLLRPEINRDITKIYDLMAIRVITADTPTCYHALGIIHQHWKPVPYLGISDFIAQPKPNGYRSIHTKVFNQLDSILEIQIRSEEMHREAEYGAAAHFAYTSAKYSGAKDEELEKGTAFNLGDKMDWVRVLANWQEQVATGASSLEDLKLHALTQHIYCFSPVGDVYDLPLNSTPVDFAFAIHSDLGFHISSAKINDKIMPLDTPLNSGDVVEIIKTKNQKKPNKNWLQFVKTSKAKSEIRKANPE